MSEKRQMEKREQREREQREREQSQRELREQPPDTRWTSVPSIGLVAASTCSLDPAFSQLSPLCTCQTLWVHLPT